MAVSSQKIDDMFNRSVLVLGLDNMRRIANDQIISVIGVGGIGSIIAEHLIHMGFNHLNLIDFDTLEISNLNRIVVATYADAAKGRVKVEDAPIERVIAASDWIMVATEKLST